MVIDLSMLSYNSGDMLKYKLEGLDQEWKSINQNYRLVYSYLPPRNYTVHASAYGADGVKGEKRSGFRYGSPHPSGKYGGSTVLFTVGGTCIFFFEQLRNKRRQSVPK